MYRMLAVAVATALFAASLPGVAVGARPDSVSDTQTEIYCDGLTTEAGTVSLYAAVSASYGGFADLAFWAAPSVPFDDPPTLFTSFGSASLGPDGSGMSASFELVAVGESTGESELPPEPAGTATMSASLSPSGDPESASEDGRDGNRQYRVEFASQPLAATGSVELPGPMLFDDLSGCFASQTSYQSWSTNPDALVSRFEDHSISCEWQDADSWIGLFASANDFGTYGEVYVSDVSGISVGFTDAALLTDRDFQVAAELVVYDPVTDVPHVVGSAAGAATLARGEPINSMDRHDGFKIRFTGSELLVSGSLTVTTEAATYVLAMDEATCFAQHVSVQTIATSPNPGGGPRLANDAPEAAVALVIGDTIKVRTGGTAPEPEQPCAISYPEWGEEEIPLGHTVWYAVVGSGEEITVDTAGSDFDTVLGVYTGDGSTLTPVICVDDVSEEDTFSLQAAVTFLAEAGVTYYIQAGGYDGAAGTLELSVH